MAARDHYTAIAPKMLHRVIQQGRGHFTDVGYFTSHCDEALDDRITQPLELRRTSRPTLILLPEVASDVGTNGSAKLLDSRAEEFVVGDSADVVFAEDCRFQHLLPEYTRADTWRTAER